jgi:hypothetical protein
LAKDRTPASGRGRPTGTSGSTGRGAAGKGGASGKGGRTRPAANVVSPQRPWGLIAAAVAVVVFAAAVITYAVVQVNEANAGRVESPDEIEGLVTVDSYEDPQDHVTTPVDYPESPPVGGPHAPPPDWADCTGTVYDVDIRHENAVHSLEHGAVWITYDADALSDADVDTLAGLVENESGRMMSPYAGLDAPISIQSWGHQLKVDSAGDPRIEQFADLFTLNNEFTPEPGASCENPTFASSPVLEADDPATGTEPSPTSETPAGTTAP